MKTVGNEELNNYTVEELKEEILQTQLRLIALLKREREMIPHPEEEDDVLLIRQALNQLMRACGLSGESGTEELFGVLQIAVQAVEEQWDDVVGQSHREGLCFDVNAFLAGRIALELVRPKREVRYPTHNAPAE
jgi:hypothetical protein